MDNNVHKFVKILISEQIALAVIVYPVGIVSTYYFAGVLQNRCSLKFRNIHKKLLVLGSLFNTIAVFQPCNYIEKKLQHRCFPVNIAKSLKKSILKNVCERLLLKFNEGAFWL